MKIFKILVIVTLIFNSGLIYAQSTKDKKIMKDAVKAKKTILEQVPDLEEFFEDSAGYVIFPNVGKGGFIIGGASGNGILYENKVAVGAANLKKLNIGLQAGGQAIIEVIFFETEKDLKDFKDGDFEFEAGASAVALKSGVSINAKYKDGVAVFALPKAGLMADASVGGQKFGYKPF
ncbi:lipid-binding SYLF domain-containing protein [Ascidiimonas sp. W6]|uniref:lipid-binding SYLF domain-containing protein n=1 Tax=Ascidiimonas meishanensis TaxID=3128903 RepID=UPI0030EB2B4E